MQQGYVGSVRAAAVLSEVVMSVVKAVKKDLAAIRKRDAALADSALAATALALAGELDDDNSATSKSMCARALVDVLEQLRGLTPKAQEGDMLDDLAARRAARIAGRAASKPARSS